MWELAPKNWCLQTVALEKTLESPLDCKEIQPVNPKGNQSWMFIGRTDAEAETPILWPSDEMNWLIGKDPDVGKDWKQKEKGTTEDEMVGWYHRLDGHEFEWAPGVGDGQGSLVCCSPWDRNDFLRKEYGGLNVLVNNAAIIFQCKWVGAGGLQLLWGEPDGAGRGYCLNLRLRLEVTGRASPPRSQVFPARPCNSFDISVKDNA